MPSLATESLRPVHWVGIACSVISGGTHLLIGVGGLPSPLAVTFVLAGVAFLVAVSWVLVDYRRRVVYAVGVPFTAAQIVLWYVLNGPPISPVAAVDKVAQVGLLAVLVVLLRRDAVTEAR